MNFIINKMERRVVKKCEDHLLDFKEQIKNWLSENEITISGVGTCMFEVGENHSIKLVGILGRMLVGMKNDVVYNDLLAGDLIELGDSMNELSDKKNVDLMNSIEVQIESLSNQGYSFKEIAIFFCEKYI